MKLKLAAAAVLLAASAGAWAAHCPADMKAIDEAQHKAGNHKDSMETLGKARKILGI